MAVDTKILFRVDTAANFTTANPTLSLGEPAYESDTSKLKIGDGSTAWTSLPYKEVGSPGPKGDTGAKGDTGTAGRGFNWRGAWVSGQNYALYDVLTDAGSCYQCILAITNSTTVPGSDGTHFSIVASKGDAGAQGIQGASGSIPIIAAGGSVDAITATFNPAITLADTQLCAFIATGANTSTTPTFAPNGLTAHTIVKKGGQALAAGDIPAQYAVCILEYNLANTRWELLNPAVSADSAFDMVQNQVFM